MRRTILVLAFVGSAAVAQGQVLWTNALRGPGLATDTGLNDQATAISGWTPTPGYRVSENQPQGSAAPTPPEIWYGNNTLGFGVQLEGTTSNALADDFDVTGTWNVNAIEVFTYETSAVGASVTGVVMQIWDGIPGQPGSSVVWGDLTTNRVATVTDELVRRIGSSVTAICHGGAPGTPGNTRTIFRVRGNTPGLTLTAGTYWLEYQLTGSTAFAGPWSPPIVRPFNRVPRVNAAEANARQRVGAAGVFNPISDAGQPRTAIAGCTTTGVDPTLAPQDLAFIIYGEAGDPCAPFDLNNDDVVDFNDYLEFLNLFNAEDPRVDYNGDMVVDFNDYLEFLNGYNACQ